MRVRRAALATLALGLSAAVGVAAPASADHVADLFPERGECRMGGQATNTYTDFWTTSIVRTTVRNGEITGFTCQFRNLGRVFYESPGDAEPLVAVDRALIYTDFECWRGPVGIPESETTTNARFVLTPGGTGTLTCKF